MDPPLTLRNAFAHPRTGARCNAVAVCLRGNRGVAVRAEAVLDANDQQLLPRLVELLNPLLSRGQAKATSRRSILECLCARLLSEHECRSTLEGRALVYGL